MTLWASGAQQLIPYNIDIPGTPFTNTLPIRRNRDWVNGEARRFDMAWVPLDTLEPFRDGQIYTPLGNGKWRFQAADGSFEAEITVDADGLVVDYPGLFSSRNREILAFSQSFSSLDRSAAIG